MRDPKILSPPFRLRLWGRNACFTRPEMKVERVSYDVMTPSAARGVLEAILWKPAMRWMVEQIDVLASIRWESVRRNEVGITMSPRSDGLFVEDQRQQRAGLFLRDVDYVIHARVELTERAGPDDSTAKFQEMFLRRARKGQCFHRPYLGCREFAAEFEPIVNGQPLPTPINETRDLGFMLYDVEHHPAAPHVCDDRCRPAFFRARLDAGTVRVPASDSTEVRR
jgi:CRISPR-associated protein Cas5d